MKYLNLIPLTQHLDSTCEILSNTYFFTKFHYMIIKHDAPKEDPWKLLWP